MLNSTEHDTKNQRKSVSSTVEGNFRSQLWSKNLLKETDDKGSSGLKVIKNFPCSTLLSMKSKIQKHTNTCMKNRRKSVPSTVEGNLEAANCWQFYFYEQKKFGSDACAYPEKFLRGGGGGGGGSNFPEGV